MMIYDEIGSYMVDGHPSPGIQDKLTNEMMTAKITRQTNVSGQMSKTAI